MNHMLILVRHSAVQVNPDAAANEWPLSEDGRIRCLPLAEKLKLYAPARFIPSHEPKARETGQIFADRLDVR